ncbi:DEAD/DEAH box helicase [Mucilaginibacter sp. SP1R1]|uniref:DEAD/DEAH box helicase n=1 Tax=Mucilaginibacter sp. SP1R1 TaxID=2723091 RepID=UPI00184C04BF|nr:SNF2 family DNA or RNA helicase [Mucilaginibacter sp. SP1R1]
MSKQSNEQHSNSDSHSFIFRDITLAVLTESEIIKNTSGSIHTDQQSYRYISPNYIEINHGAFVNLHTGIAFPEVIITQHDNLISASCDCDSEPGKLCQHEAQVLNAIIKRDELRVFFDNGLRQEMLKKIAVDYGMEQEPNLDNFFDLVYLNKKVQFNPKSPGLMQVTKESLNTLNSTIHAHATPSQQAIKTDEQTVCVLLKEHKYYKYLFIELFKAPTTKDGKIKNPLTPIPPLEPMWETDDAQQLKFFTGINKFQNHLNANKTEADLIALRAILKNPLDYKFYYHDTKVSDNATASSVIPIKVSVLPNHFKLTVNPGQDLFELTATLNLNGYNYELKELNILFTYFILANDTLYLVDNLQVLHIMDLLKKKQNNILIHPSKFQEFKTQFLTKLEEKIDIDYKHIKPATSAQLEQHGFNSETEKIIYLSDFGTHVMIIPVMRYGEVEISIRTKKQIYGIDAKGNEFLVKRKDDEEIDFTALLLKQHPYMEEQLENDLHYFYLHKKHFLDEEWFLTAFEEWQHHQITVLGFNELEGNKLNPHKVKITIKVLSGINWFNTQVNVRFGKTRAALKQVYRAVKNKSKYIKLDDGTSGILPEEWIEKFEGYFNSGEIADDDSIRIPKINFTAIEQLYDAEMLDDGVKDELNIYHQKLADFDSVKQIEIPESLNATLRPYQKQGLNWLNFLDDFNFGGCLADDMGLGKSIQVIAFILSQREKNSHNTNLIVVPTSLIFNWQQELAKFAPSIKLHTIYGADRIKNIDDFDQYEVILTSYGTLLSDIVFLKNYHFNYVFLDESQNIKNPESQRYRAVRLLKSRNKITITGTPIENNTFDLYGQLSFACPGLLGSKQYFKDIYSSPIDKFKSSKRAVELQNKIRPFILRRTKQQVATDLPEKTEMVLYCEMGQQQRNIYNTYEKEFREFISATTSEVLKKTPMNVLKGITKLRQICDSPLLLTGEKMPGDASAKIDTLIEQIEGKMAQHKILVFSQFVTMLDLIRKKLTGKGIAFTYLTGQTRNREAVVNEFQNNPEVRVFLISLKAGGTGLNLTEADYVYLVDPWWNPAVENQAIDRCHRIGQDKKIVAVRLICPGTVEEKIMLMQQNKKALANELIQTDSSFVKSLSKQDLLNLLK